MKLKAITIITIIILNNYVSFCQSKEDVLFFNKKHNELPQSITTTAHKSNSTLDYVLLLTFKFYKSFISSQDSQSCSFSLSCSEYAVHSINKYGLFFGVLNTFDRLSRCNGLNRGDYSVDNHSNLLIDTVKNAHYK